jgi:hypothetical protein
MRKTVRTQYLVTDPLGSTRMVLNGSGVATEMIDYRPFGEEIRQGVGGRGSLYPAGFPNAVLGRRSEGTPRPSLVFSDSFLWPT